MAEVDGGDILIRIRGDASELEAEIGRAQGALGDLGGSADDTGEGLGGMGDAAGSAGKALQGMSKGGVRGLATGLRAVNPEMGAALSGFVAMQRALPALTTATNVQTSATARLSAAFKGLMVSLGPIGVTLIAAIAVYQALESVISDANEELEKQNEQLKINAERHKRMNQAVGTLRDLEASVARELALVTGEMTKQQVELLDFNAEVDRTTAALIKEAEALDMGAEASAEAIKGINARAAALKNQNAELSHAVAERDRIVAEIEAEAAARKEAAAATKDQARAIREQAQAEAAIQRQRQNQRDKEKADQDAADQAQAEKEEKKRSKEDADGKAAAKRDAAIQQGVRDSISATADLSMTLSDVVSDKNATAAKRLFRISQAASLTQVAMNTAVGITKSIAELGPVAGAVAAVGVGLTGAAQAAAIAAQSPPPTAHIGTGMPGSRDPLAPDERMSGGRRVLTTEASGPAGVTNSMGTQLINDVNTGRVQSSGRITATIGRTHLDRELFRSGRRGTSRYARALRTNPHPKPQGGY